MEVLVMRSNNELHSQELFPSKKLPCLSHFSMFMTLISAQHSYHLLRKTKW